MSKAPHWSDSENDILRAAVAADMDPVQVAELLPKRDVMAVLRQARKLKLEISDPAKWPWPNRVTERHGFDLSKKAPLGSDAGLRALELNDSPNADRLALRKFSWEDAA